MTECRYHAPKRREYLAVGGVSYGGFECSTCGQRNVGTEGDESRVDRRLFDLFVGWKFHMVRQIGFDYAVGSPTFTLEPADLPEIEIGIGHLELAAINTSLNGSDYHSASPTMERL